MNIILLKKIASLGQIGKIVKVKAGYARNYLIPQGFAALATKETIESFKLKQSKLLEAEALEHEEAKKRAEEMKDIEITLTAKAGALGKLFGSFTAKDLAEAINQAGFKVSKKEIALPSGPIRSVGEYNIVINLHPDVSATIKVFIVAEEK